MRSAAVARTTLQRWGDRHGCPWSSRPPASAQGRAPRWRYNAQPGTPRSARDRRRLSRTVLILTCPCCGTACCSIIAPKQSSPKRNRQEKSESPEHHHSQLGFVLPSRVLVSLSWSVPQQARPQLLCGAALHHMMTTVADVLVPHFSHHPRSVLPLAVANLVMEFLLRLALPPLLLFLPPLPS